MTSVMDSEKISNEAKLYEIANYIDNSFFTESIRDQIRDALDSSSVDYLNELYVKIENIKETYDEYESTDIVLFQEELNRTIIDDIRNKYSINIEYDDDELSSIAKNLYHFFVIDLKEIIIAFLVAYIQENYKYIIQNIELSKFNTTYLSIDESIDDQSELLVLTNIGTIIDEISNTYIEFDKFIQYAATNGDILSLSEIVSGGHVLSFSDSDSVVSDLLRNIRNDSYDFNIIVTVVDLLSAAFNILTVKGELM